MILLPVSAHVAQSAEVAGGIVPGPEHPGGGNEPVLLVSTGGRPLARTLRAEVGLGAMDKGRIVQRIAFVDAEEYHKRDPWRRFVTHYIIVREWSGGLPFGGLCSLESWLHFLSHPTLFGIAVVPVPGGRFLPDTNRAISES